MSALNEAQVMPLGEHQHSGAVRPWKLCVVTFCLVFFPLSVTYIKFRHGVALNFLAGDAFYYLDVARNWQSRPIFTFDGVHPTNGFHPLWQYLLGLLGHLPQFSFSGHDPIGSIFLLDCVIVAVGYGLLAIFSARQVRISWLVP